MGSVLPVRDEVSTVWFEAVDRGELLIQLDPLTGNHQMYPRAHVVGVPDRAPDWVRASGRATLYSFTVVKRSVHPQFSTFVPFVIGIVELEEGPRLTSWVVDVPEDQLRCDLPLSVVFREIHPGLRLPCFTKA
ncbi:hypothetical protein Sa4125_47250 (plasmid) [Aureimonas sp. SA4125]|nr:hypothetical protein Sa4125_47250 [Aureimonas sp. SA4125]